MITKPLRISRINWGNPITRGMIFCVPLNEMAGAATSITPQSITSANSMGAASWNAQGVYNSAVANNLVSFATQSAQFGTGNFTVLSFEITPAAGTYAYTVSNHGPLTTQTYTKWWGLCANLTDGGTAGSGNYSFLTYDAALSNTGAAGMLDGLPHVFVGRRSGTTHSLWRDGVQANSKTLTVRNVSGDVGELALGLRTSNVNYASIGTRLLLAGWSRALTDAEITRISSNPYQLLAQSSAQSLLMKMVQQAGFFGASRGRSLAGISRGRMI